MFYHQKLPDGNLKALYTNPANWHNRNDTTADILNCRNKEYKDLYDRYSLYIKCAMWCQRGKFNKIGTRHLGLLCTRIKKNI